MLVIIMFVLKLILFFLFLDQLSTERKTSSRRCPEAGIGRVILWLKANWVVESSQLVLKKAQDVIPRYDAITGQWAWGVLPLIPYPVGPDRGTSV